MIRGKLTRRDLVIKQGLWLQDDSQHYMFKIFGPFFLKNYYLFPPTTVTARYQEIQLLVEWAQSQGVKL